MTYAIEKLADANKWKAKQLYAIADNNESAISKVVSANPGSVVEDYAARLIDCEDGEIPESLVVWQ